MADYDFSAPSKAEKEQFESEYNLAPPTAEELSQIKSDSEEKTSEFLKGLGRTILQGPSASFSDEAIARARSILEGGTVAEKQAEESKILEEFQKRHPKLALGAEIGGGLLGGYAIGKAAPLVSGVSPKLASAMTSLSTATPRTQSIGRSVLSGAVAGGITGVGKQETPISDIGETAKSFGVGAGIGAGAGLISKGLSSLATKIPKSLAEISPSGAAAKEYVEKTGKKITGEESVSLTGDVAQDLAKKLIIAREEIPKRFEYVLKKADEEGVSVFIPEEVSNIIKRNFKRLGDTEKLTAYKILQTAEENEGKVIASDAGKLKKLVTSLMNTTPKTDETQNLIANLTEAKSILRKSIQETLPQYNQLNEAAQKLYQLIEIFPTKGFEPLTDEAGQLLGRSEISKIGKNISGTDLSKSIIKYIENAGMRTQGPDTLKRALNKFSEKLANLSTQEKKFIADKVIPENLSYFSKGLVGSPEQITSDLAKNIQYAAARVYGLGRRSEQTGEVLESSLRGPIGFIKDLYGEGVKMGELVAESETLRWFGSAADAILAGNKAISPYFNNMPDFVLGTIAGKLGNYSSTKPYADMLKESQKTGDVQKRNVALFALQNDPSKREILNQIVVDLNKEYKEANEEVKLERSPASRAAASDYQRKRNEFIATQESGPNALDQQEFRAYEDRPNDIQNSKRTIGYGYNLEASGQYSKMKKILNIPSKEAEEIFHGRKAITKEQALKLLNHSVKKAETILDKKLSSIKNAPSLNPNQRMALVSMIYNSPKLVGPRIMAALESGDMDKVARLIRITSNSQADILPGLVKRREEEANLFSQLIEEEFAGLIP